MDFIKIRSPFQTDEYGSTASCMLYTEDRFTMGDVSRLRRSVEDCKETTNEFDDQTFDEFMERVVRAHNKKHGTKFDIVYPSYEVDV